MTGYLLLRYNPGWVPLLQDTLSHLRVFLVALNAQATNEHMLARYETMVGFARHEDVTQLLALAVKDREPWVQDSAACVLDSVA